MILMAKFWPFRLNAKGDKRPWIYTNHIHFYSKLSLISVADDSPDFIHNFLENIPWNVSRTIDKTEILNEFWARSSWNYDMAWNQRYQWKMSPLISLVIIPEKTVVLFSWKLDTFLKLSPGIEYMKKDLEFENDT